MARRAPAWWRSVRRSDPRLAQVGEQVEQGVWNQLHAVRPESASQGAPGEPWRVSLKSADANAWLNTRLEMWIANQYEEAPWPEQVSEVQVHFGEGDVLVGARLATSDGPRYLSARIRPRLEADGSLWIPAHWVYVGRLGIPAEPVLHQAWQDGLEVIPESVRDLPETRALFEALRGRAPIVRDAAVRLGDGRVVRLLSFRTRDGRLEVACRTEDAGVPQARDEPR